ncbi:hypothetical protein Gmet_1557 [Geobacter metallireducens GS-15]|uniref:Uncharacterized protein n=1 Tax=Geobacter metallireducens (strain ATCC 53774 / DSM 7210 / GS-15) TaxID=269799 RepID=Q39VD3_GEOMG|nr:hypothetical protein Gmet_1557 [Geobacter metallireducens GS-15]
MVGHCLTLRDRKVFLNNIIYAINLLGNIPQRLLNFLQQLISTSAGKFTYSFIASRCLRMLTIAKIDLRSQFMTNIRQCAVDYSSHLITATITFRHFLCNFR